MPSDNDAYDLTMLLPAELLGHCLSWLPFLDLVRAACVSRYWRSTALLFPALWSDIRLLDGRSEHTLVQLTRMALARSRGHPVDLDCGVDAVAPLLIEHMHHLRSVLWLGSTLDCFTSDAPMLECFRYASSVAFPQNFLGGKPGALRCLELRGLFLPSECPALVNVTHVRTGMANDDLGEALVRLWALCPRLERLTLRDMADVPLLTAIPPPDTLSFLEVQTPEKDCNLGEIIAACSTPALKRISVSLPLRASRSLVEILRSALVLAVEPGRARSDKGPMKSAFALLPEGRQVEMIFNDCDAGHGIGVMLDNVLTADASFVHLRSLTMPLLLLYMFIRGRPAMPYLRDLGIIVQQAPHRDSRFDWTRIYCLSLLGHYRLATIALEIRYFSRTCDPRGDAATLVRHIVQHNRLPDVQYTVYGFPPEVAREVEIPQHSPKIAFEPSSRTIAPTMASGDYLREAFDWDNNLSREEIPLNRHRFGRPEIVR